MRYLWRATAALAAAACVAVLAGAAAPSASAGLFCGGSAGSQVFLPWLDVFSYSLAPGGSFESGTPAWSLSRGAGYASDNESFDLSGAGSRSLALDAGESATSPGYCASLTQLDLRLVARGSGSVRVDVLGGGLFGLNLLQSATFSVGSSWAPSPIMVFTNGLLGLTTQTIYFRVTAVSGSAEVDDVFVDPFLCK